MAQIKGIYGDGSGGSKKKKTTVTSTPAKTSTTKPAATPVPAKPTKPTSVNVPAQSYNAARQEQLWEQQYKEDLQAAAERMTRQKLEEWMQMKKHEYAQ